MERGFCVDAVDGSEKICEIASTFIGIPVQKMLFQELDAVDLYDGIWACSSILHLPKTELKDVFGRMCKALKSDGVIYTSFKYGKFEGIRNGRYFTDFTEETFSDFLKGIPGIGLEELWITNDVRPDRGEEKWLNLMLRKSDTIVNLISENVTETTFDAVIDEMIANAWYSVVEFHVHLSGMMSDINRIQMKD
jgi:hypothetical protein